MRRHSIAHNRLHGSVADVCSVVHTAITFRPQAATLRPIPVRVSTLEQTVLYLVTQNGVSVTSSIQDGRRDGVKAHLAYIRGGI